MSLPSDNSLVRKSLWPEVMTWLRACEAALPALWPPELPPEQTLDFWFVACRHEMRTRQEISTQIRRMIETGDSGTVSPLAAWLIRRRLEWAGQMALAGASRKVEPAGGVAEALYEVLVLSWETDGCIGMWNHAERDGKPHPENPDGLSPLRSMGD